MAFEFLIKGLDEAQAKGADSTEKCMKSIERRFSMDILHIVRNEYSKKYNKKQMLGHE